MSKVKGLSVQPANRYVNALIHALFNSCFEMQ